MPTGGAALMRSGKNLLKLARKEQCLALLCAPFRPCLPPEPAGPLLWQGFSKRFRSLPGRCHPPRSLRWLRLFSTVLSVPQSTADPACWAMRYGKEC